MASLLLPRVASHLLRSSSKNASWLVVSALSTAGVFSAPTTTRTPRCDGSTGNNDDDVLPRDNEGNIDWSKAVSKFQGGDIWDAVASAAGGKMQAGIDSGIPTQLSYGFISGYCSGYALKKVGKTAAVVFGMGFMSLQTLSYYGYVKVDHVQIRRDVEGFLDLNDDGRIDGQDGAIAYSKLLSVLQFNLPGGSGFAMGFVGGLRSG